jgi:hypothetical protein
MKKALLFVSLIGFALGVYAQSVVVNATSFTISASKVLYVGASDTTFELVAPLKVTNTSGSPINVYVKKIIVDTLATSSNFFCLAGGVCFGSNTYTSSPTFMAVSVGSPDTVLGDYEPNGVIGTSRIRYLIYNKSNALDSASILITFQTTSLAGIAPEVANGETKISAAYPNPSNTAANFTYSLSRDVKKAHVKIYDMLGAQVNQISLEGNQNSVQVNTAGMVPGIYFCSFVTDDKLVTTQRLIVTH